MKVLLIGRHQGVFPAEAGIEVIRQESINFPASANECRSLLENMAADLEDEGIEGIVFQAIPNQVAMALPDVTWFSLKVGAVINRPGERLAGVVREWWDEGADSPLDGSDIRDAVSFANPRAKIEIVPRTDDRFGRIIRVEVDPPLRFEFSHIEWLG